MEYKNYLINIMLFSIKIGITFIFFVASINYLVPTLPENERNKLIATSFIQNPFILWRLSENSEMRGKIDSSIMYIESAIGLIEMNGGSEKVLSKYQSKLEELKKKR